MPAEAGVALIERGSCALGRSDGATGQSWQRFFLQERLNRRAV